MPDLYALAKHLTSYKQIKYNESSVVRALLELSDGREVSGLVWRVDKFYGIFASKLPFYRNN